MPGCHIMLHMSALMQSQRQLKSGIAAWSPSIACDVLQGGSEGHCLAWPVSVRAHVCMPPAATCTTLCLGRHGVGSGTSRLPWATPHWPYSLPPQAYAWPVLDTARQCQPPHAACTTLMPLSAAMRRGFLSLPLRNQLQLISSHQGCSWMP